MLLKPLMKRPVLGMGIVMMFIFLSLYGRQFAEKVGRSFWQGGLETTSCRGALAMLRRNLPRGHKAWCEGNHLALDISYSSDGRQLGDVRTNILCPILYRELANHWKLLADSPAPLREILARVDSVRLRLIHPRLSIYSAATGANLVRMAGIKTMQGLVDHFRETIRVQESPATCY